MTEVQTVSGLGFDCIELRLVGCLQIIGNFGVFWQSNSSTFAQQTEVIVTRLALLGTHSQVVSTGIQFEKRICAITHISVREQGSDAIVEFPLDFIALYTIKKEA
ncbi:hypothetical protein UNDYM_6013 (plasmid) [Undibacterium sp. YM2]|nr:hypothetical protein UNDYM_6013 [Undibacterium sp. YM2]